MTNGRDSRLSQIGSGAKETGGWPQSGRFEHDTFGSFAASSGDFISVTMATKVFRMNSIRLGFVWIFLLPK